MLQFYAFGAHLNSTSESHPQGIVHFLLGSVLERCYWKLVHGRRPIGAKHSLGHQLFGFSSQEALAKCPLFVHQEHYGTCSTALLDLMNKSQSSLKKPIVYSFIFSRGLRPLNPTLVKLGLFEIVFHGIG